MRFEFSEGGSNKFWDIERAGSQLTIKFGKIGASGQTQLKSFGSDAEAIAAHDKLVAEKTKKGYVQVGGKAPKAAPAPAKAKSSSGIKPTSLEIKPLAQNEIHRIVVRDRAAVATGTGCFATSNGKKFHRRDSPGTSYGLFDIDGKIYSMGGPYAVTSDAGATWKTLKAPIEGYIFVLAKDGKGTWWMGGDNGVVVTSDKPDKNWKEAPFKTAGKVLAIVEVDGLLFFVGGGGIGTWDGAKYRAVKGFSKKDIVTRMTEAPSGALIAIGDGGIAYRSTDRGKSFSAVKSGVKVDLEDCAWVAGALFVVGAQGTLLRSLDEGKTFKSVPTKTQKLWSIASWGDGAFIGGDGGIFALAAPNDPYWKGAADTFEPPPPSIDATFEVRAAVSGRDAVFKKLFAAATAEHDTLSASLKRPVDANAKLAKTVDEGTDGADQVYADWLSDQGDPRGELAQVQLRLARDPKNKELKKLEKKLLATHSEALLGKLATVSSMLDLEWHAGFITKARIAQASDDDFDIDTDVDDEGEEIEKPPVEKVLGWLLDHPSGRFLRDLTIGIVVRDDENSYGNVAKTIGARYLPSLRSLFLGDFTYEDTELNWSTLGNLAPMWPALPNLETLKLRSGSMKLGDIVLPKLREFTVITGGMDSKSAKAIAAARWPSLETLSLQIGPEGSPEVKLKDLEPILDGASLPRLNHLGITNFNHTGKLIEPLAHSKILPQLSELDLKMGTLGDEHAARMFGLQKAFAHLEKLDVHDNYLTADGKTHLKKAKLPFHFGEQRDDEGPDERYASAYE